MKMLNWKRHGGIILILLVLFLFLNSDGNAGEAENIELSNRHTRLILNKETNYSLESIIYRKTEFNCGETGKFPVFKLIAGKRIVTVSPDNPDLISRLSSRGKNKVSVIYDYSGSKIKVSYKLSPQSIKMEFKILQEKDYKFLSIGSKEGLILVARDSLKDIRDAKIIVPARQGLQISFADKKGIYFSSKGNPFGLWNSIDSFGGWVMNANFVSMIKDNTGIIIRPNEHSCRFMYGIKKIAQKEQLFLDIPYYFRPVKTGTDEMALLHRSLKTEITFCADENEDNEVDWVDIGICYRDRYIKPCRNVDGYVKEALIGKLHVGLGYHKQLQGIKKMNFAPQIWWLTGSHVEGGGCYDQNWWVFEPAAGYGDYFKFKEEALKYNARIGVHQNLDDVYQDKGWNQEEVRKTPNGGLWKGGIWGGRQAYLRDINRVEKNKKIYKRINDWFSTWDVKKGDTWHYDVFAAIELTENYDLNHPATKETDFYSRYKILKYIARKKGVKITSEMVTEGLHEYLSFGLHNPCYYHYSKVPASTWEIVEEIPLYPVLFLGRAYIGDLGRPKEKDTLSYARAILLGVKKVKWFGVISPEDAQDVYFKQNLFWSQICDLSVADIDREGDKYSIVYSDNSKLMVDFNKDDFVYKKGGITYEGFSPFNSRGYMAVWINPYSIVLKENSYLKSLKGVKHKCLFYPDGTLNITGDSSGKRLVMLKRTPFSIYPERKLAVELIGDKMLDEGRTRYAFKIETEEEQIVNMRWRGGADWFNEDNECIGRDRSKFNMEVKGEKVLYIETAIPVH
jgi:hypothetical protein